jgi:hypothetical protein
MEEANQSDIPAYSSPKETSDLLSVYHFCEDATIAPPFGSRSSGRRGASPEATIGWRLIEGLLELRLLLWREKERAARIAVAAVAQVLGTLVMAAMGEGADPW